MSFSKSLFDVGHVAKLTVTTAVADGAFLRSVGRLIAIQSILRFSLQFFHLNFFFFFFGLILFLFRMLGMINVQTQICDFERVCVCV